MLGHYHFKAPVQNWGDQNIEAVKDTADLYVRFFGVLGLDIKSFSTFSTSISLPWHKLTQIDQGCIIYWKTLRPLEHLYWARSPWSWKLDLLGLQDTGTLGFSLGTAGCWIPSKLQALKPGKGKALEVLRAERSHIDQCVEETIGTNRCQSHTRSPWANL